MDTTWHMDEIDIHKCMLLLDLNIISCWVSSVSNYTFLAPDSYKGQSTLGYTLPDELWGEHEWWCAQYCHDYGMKHKCWVFMMFAKMIIKCCSHAEARQTTYANYIQSQHSIMFTQSRERESSTLFFHVYTKQERVKRSSQTANRQLRHWSLISTPSLSPHHINTGW